MKFDLHVHTNLSYDSAMSTSELVAAAKKAGLSGVATCDHNIFRSHRSRDGIYFIPACEFSTDVGHLVVYFMKSRISEGIPRDEAGRFYWRDVCKLAKDQDALVFLAHPFSPEKEHPDTLYSAMDGIEVFNSRVAHSRIKDANNRAIELCKKLGKPFSAGSDAHSPIEVGSTFWECDLPESAMDEPDFEEKLKAELLSCKGRVFAGSVSPFKVLSCKRAIYRSQHLFLRLFKNYIQLIITAIKSLKKEPKTTGYIDLNAEENI